MAVLTFFFVGLGLSLQSHLYSVSDSSMVALADSTRLNRTEACPVRLQLVTTSQKVRGKTNSFHTPPLLLLDALWASPTRPLLLCVGTIPDPFFATVTARWILTELVAVALPTADFATYAFGSAGEAIALSASPNSKHYHMHVYQNVIHII